MSNNPALSTEHGFASVTLTISYTVPNTPEAIDVAKDALYDDLIDAARGQYHTLLNIQHPVEASLQDIPQWLIEEIELAHPEDLS
jgi:hypothetical protein